MLWKDLLSITQAEISIRDCCVSWFVLGVVIYLFVWLRVRNKSSAHFFFIVSDVRYVGYKGKKTGILKVVCESTLNGSVECRS